MRLGIVGCGAAARKLHLPAVALGGSFQLTALVDSVLTHAVAAADRYRELTRDPHPLITVTDSLDGALDRIDAAVVATASASHADIAVTLLRAGKHVLVEKPMALSLAQCERLRAAAEAGGAIILPGHVRRLFPLAPWVKSMLDSGRLGAVRRVHWAEGGPYDWGVSGNAMFGLPSAGGGVLADTGPHVFDTLHYWFGAAGDATVTRLATNSTAGADSESTLTLEFGATTVEIQLSRLRALADQIVIEAEHATVTIDIDIDDAGYVERDPSGTIIGSGPIPVLPGAVDSWESLFATQLAGFDRAIAGEPTPLAGFDDGVAVARLLQTCRAMSPEPLARPWADTRPATCSPPAGRVAVTGATGFIGAHLVERMVDVSAHTRVVAVAHDLRKLARLSHLDQDRLSCARADIRDRASLKALFQGCDVVVHTVCGSTGGPAEQYSVTVDGTAAVLQAAADAGVRRLVHLSTVDVYAPAPGTALDEDSPRVSAQPGLLSYAQQKLAAEDLVLSRAGGRMEVVCLQPTIVYGPWSAAWTVSVLEDDLRDANDSLPTGPDIGPDGQPTGGICNALHVHDLADAVLAVSTAPGVDGLRLLVSGPEAIGWGAYYDVYRRLLGVPSPQRYDSEKAEPSDRALYASRVVVRTDRLADVAFRPRIGIEEGMAQVGAWAAWAGLC